MRYVQTFDGLEGEPAHTFGPPCPRCGAARPLELWSFVARARSGAALSDAEVDRLGLHRSVIHGGFVVTTVGPDQPWAYVGELPCPACGASAAVAVGLHEFQPCRWMGGVVR